LLARRRSSASAIAASFSGVRMGGFTSSITRSPLVGRSSTGFDGTGGSGQSIRRPPYFSMCAAWYLRIMSSFDVLSQA